MNKEKCYFCFKDLLEVNFEYCAYIRLCYDCGYCLTTLKSFFLINELKNTDNPFIIKRLILGNGNSVYFFHKDIANDIDIFDELNIKLINKEEITRDKIDYVLNNYENSLLLK